MPAQASTFSVCRETRRARAEEHAMTTKTIEWIRDGDQALAEAKRTGRPALLDFSAAPM